VFSGGADVKEFGTTRARQEPTLGALIKIIEASAKPVVAAISGLCLGGGFELATGCRFRIAMASAKLGYRRGRAGSAGPVLAAHNDCRAS